MARRFRSARRLPLCLWGVKARYAARPVDLLPDVRFKVAVASGKGGVGKSTLTANLALALVRLGQRVGLLDGDIYGPYQQLMMGIDEKPFVDKKDNKLLTIERHGVRVATLGAVMNADEPAVWRGPMVMKAVDQLLAGVRWGRLDFLLVDLPPGTGDVQLTLTQRVSLSGAVIVTTPQEVALIDARKGLNMFRKMNVPLLGIVENMSYYLCPQCGHEEGIFKRGGGRKTAEALKVPFLGEIPIDPRIAEGGDSGQPILALAPESPSAQAYLRVAEMVKGALATGADAPGDKALDNTDPRIPH
jgi:ATP-binding protein involved in chromosome partitioning